MHLASRIIRANSAAGPLQASAVHSVQLLSNADRVRGCADAVNGITAGASTFCRWRGFDGD
jgi:hypothetical protein